VSDKRREILDALKLELRFLETGGYENWPLANRATLSLLTPGR
jgi:hypothetical protein